MKSLKTKEHIAKTLIESVSEIPLKKMSVNNLCLRANISRGSFYYHFNDINDLICWIYRTYITLPINELITSSKSDLQQVTNSSLNLLYSNKEFFIQAFNMSDQNGLGDFAKKEIKSRFLQIWKAYLKTKRRSPKQDGYMNEILNYFSNAHYYTLLSWIEDGMVVPPKQMAQILITVSKTAIRYAIDQGSFQE